MDKVEIVARLASVSMKPAKELGEPPITKITVECTGLEADAMEAMYEFVAYGCNVTFERVQMRLGERRVLRDRDALGEVHEPVRTS